MNAHLQIHIIAYWIWTDAGSAAEGVREIVPVYITRSSTRSAGFRHRIHSHRIDDQAVIDIEAPDIETARGDIGRMRRPSRSGVC